MKTGAAGSCSRRRKLVETEFVAFDLETTGLFPVVNRIVEFGAVRFVLDGRELGTWEQLVDPECPIPPEVTDIHGVTDAMVHGKPTLVQVLPGFLDFLGVPDTILLAHNATFDLGFLNFAAAKTGLTLPANHVIDTLDLARTCSSVSRRSRSMSRRTIASETDKPSANRAELFVALICLISFSKASTAPSNSDIRIRGSSAGLSPS